MERDNKEISIRFSADIRDGGYYEARSDFDVFYDLGENQLIEIGKAFNTFLKQCTFGRKNDYLFMEDVSEDEYDFLQNALERYRQGTTTEFGG